MAFVGCRYKDSGAVAAGLLGIISNGQPVKLGILAGSKHNLAVAKRVQGLQDTIQLDFPNIKIKCIYEAEDSDELAYDLTIKMIERYPEITAICFCGAGQRGGIKALKQKDSMHRLKVVAFDLLEVTKEALENNIITATICQEPYKQGYDGVQIMGKYLLFGQKPNEDLQYTKITIITKYGI